MVTRQFRCIFWNCFYGRHVFYISMGCRTGHQKASLCIQKTFKTFEGLVHKHGMHDLYECIALLILLYTTIQQIYVIFPLSLPLDGCGRIICMKTFIPIEQGCGHLLGLVYGVLHVSDGASALVLLRFL